MTSVLIVLITHIILFITSIKTTNKQIELVCLNGMIMCILAMAIILCL